MFTLSVRSTFAAAHRLEEYQGKCEELHGHNFQVEVFCQGMELGPGGMLLDFKVLKGHLETVVEMMDHKYLNEIPFFQERHSSSEYIAMFVFQELKGRLRAEGVELKEVRVWESDKAWAGYHE